MRVVVVVGEGAIGNDCLLQSEEFWIYALDIAKTCLKAGARVLFLASKGVSGQKFTKAAPDCPMIFFETTRDALKLLRDTSETQLVFMIGHGTSGRGQGWVHLTHVGENQHRMINSDDIAPLGRCVYVGLHCHAEDFTAALPASIPAFHLTGKGTGKNFHIQNFVQSCASQCMDLCVVLAWLETADEDTWEDAQAAAMQKLQALTAVDSPGCGVSNDFSLWTFGAQQTEPVFMLEREPISWFDPPEVNNNAFAFGQSTSQAPPPRPSSFNRMLDNSVGSGFRIGIATWNARGLSKARGESSGEGAHEAEEEDGRPLAVITDDELTRALNILTRCNAIQNSGVNPSDLDWDSAGSGFTWASLTKWAARWNRPYVGKQIVHYRQLRPAWNPPGQVETAKDTGDADALLQQIDGLLQENTLKTLVPRLLTRRLSCLAILELFEKHDWLDVLVLQEVKSTGIELLYEQVKDKLCVFAGPLMKSSGKQKAASANFIPC